MINTFQCSTCGGQYQDKQPDGLLYFHACPPVFDPQAKVWGPQPNARDETIAFDAKGNPTGIKSAGKGVVPTGATVAAQPDWIDPLTKRVAKLDV